ncbi:MAG TPA: hypothetical protein VFQ76_21020 [Longimicrobiaceae bacterium]|nr:hypothetical protein [Longimicrobiaceae bacterium]
MRATLPLLAAAARLAGCGAERPRTGAQEPTDDTAAAAAAPAPADSVASPAAWKLAPVEGVALRGGEALSVETGPHVVLWRQGQAPVRPPYTVRARMQKVHGRLHEGYGIVIGGEALDGPESGQRYSYFLVRGDGSFLIRRRAGAEIPVVRPWTTDPAIRRDSEEGGRPNELEVRVAADSVSFLVNGRQVARVGASEVDASGIPGVRVAHQVQLQLTGFSVETGGAGAGAQR